MSFVTHCSKIVTLRITIVTVSVSIPLQLASVQKPAPDTALMLFLKRFLSTVVSPCSNTQKNPSISEDENDCTHNITYCSNSCIIVIVSMAIYGLWDWKI